MLDAFGAFHSAQNTGIFDQKSNGTNQRGLVRAKYLRPPLKVVYIARSGHFCRLDCRNVPVHLTKLLCPLPLICMILFASTITKAQWLGSGPCNPNVPSHWAHEIPEISNRNSSRMESALSFSYLN